MRLFSAIVILLLCAVLPSSGKQQQSETQNKQGSAAVTPNQSGGVTVIVNQPAATPQTQSPKEHPHDCYNWISQWFAPTTLLTLALVIVAGFAAKAAFASLDQIKKQAKAAEDAAQAALLSAKAIIGAERARLAINVELSQFLGGVEDTDTKSDARFTITCRNCGKTAAWIYETVADYAIIDGLPHHPVFSRASETKFGIHYRDSGESFTEPFALTIPAPYDGSKRRIIQGVVRFNDVYDKKGEATFGYWILEDLTTIHRIEESVTYNRNTYED